MIDRDLLARYFRQLRELGIDEVVLDGLTAGQALDLLAGRAPAAAGAAAAGPHGSTTAAPAAPAASVPSVTSVASTARAAAAGAAAARPMTARELAAAAGLEPDGAATAAAAAAQASAPAVVAPAVVARAAVSPPPADQPAARPRLRVLAEAAAGCTRCGLHTTRTNVVFGEGSPNPQLVVVGEAPGGEEDRTGRPFVGRAGRLLDLLLMSAGFPRESVYICNVLKCRPPNNRDPLPGEVSTCSTSWLHDQLEALAPKTLLAVGRFAVTTLLQTEERIGRLRGSVGSYRGTPVVVSYHPAYLLRSPQMTRVAWQDFQLLRKVLDEQTRG